MIKDMYQLFDDIPIYEVTSEIFELNEDNYDIQINHEGKLTITDPLFFTMWKLTKDTFSVIVTYLKRKNDSLSIRFPSDLDLKSQFEMKQWNRQLQSSGGIAMPYHTNSHIELCYVIEGELKVKIENEVKVLKENEALLLDMNTLHSEYIQYKDARVVFLGISLEMFRVITMSLELSPDFSRFLTVASMDKKGQGDYLHLDLRNQKVEFEKLIVWYYHEIKHKSPGYELIMEGLIKRISCLINDAEFIHVCIESHRQREILFEEIQRYLYVHHKSVRLNEISVVLGYSEDYLNRIIKEITGSTYSELLKEIRLQLAVKKLMETDMSIHDIVSEIGYSNVQFFYQVFKEKFCMTPNDYRKRFKS